MFDETLYTKDFNDYVPYVFEQQAILAANPTEEQADLVLDNLSTRKRLARDTVEFVLSRPNRTSVADLRAYLKGVYGVKASDPKSVLIKAAIVKIEKAAQDWSTAYALVRSEATAISTRFYNLQRACDALAKFGDNTAIRNSRSTTVAEAYDETVIEMSDLFVRLQLSDDNPGYLGQTSTAFEALALIGTVCLERLFDERLLGGVAYAEHVRLEDLAVALGRMNAYKALVQAILPLTIGKDEAEALGIKSGWGSILR